MNFRLIQRLYQLDWLLLAAVLLLVFLGLAVIYSITLGQGNDIGGGILYSPLLHKQIISLTFGIVLFFIFSLINYRLFYVYSRYLFWGIIILLLAVLFFGNTIRGTTGWFEFGGFGFQPVEVAKLVLIIILAKYFTTNGRYLAQFRHVVFSGIIVLIIMGLVLLQPDFGSAVILILIWAGMMFAVGIPKKYLTFAAFAAILVGILSWSFFLQDYQKDRIAVFLNPQADPQGSGYHVAQSIIAIGSGQLFGKGLGFGSQSHLKFLPESHTDFIFAVIAEEMGFFSVIFLFSLFIFLYYRLIKISKDSIDDFGSLLCVGIVISLFCQMFINLAMNMGILPVTGLPLPFVSFGGSSLIMSFAMIGVAQNVHIKSKLAGIKM
ncbi:MAG: rod shape-determining protein RodA [bacterium]